jgi:hypothetical protein
MRSKTTYPCPSHLSVLTAHNYFFYCTLHSEDAVLRCTLQSLACGKKKVLKKRPPGRDVNDDDIFIFNDAFEDPRAKVHINSIQVKETVGAPLFPSNAPL